MLRTLRRAQRQMAWRALAVVYPELLHLVTLPATKVASIEDLRGKRISVGLKGSAAQTHAMRMLEAAGLDPHDKGIEPLGIEASSDRIRKAEIDAFFLFGIAPDKGLASNLANLDGVSMQLVDIRPAVDALRRRYGPIYSADLLSDKTYVKTGASGVIGLWHMLVVSESMPDDVAYTLTRSLFARQNELSKIRAEAKFMQLGVQSIQRSAIPYHAGAAKYFAEQGIEVSR